MHISARLFALILIQVLATSQISRAETIVETAYNWGLVGPWRPDCNLAPSRSNDQLAFVVKEGKLFLDREFGDARDSSQVVYATKKPEGTIEYIIKFDSLSQTRQIVDFKESEGRKRTLSNKNLDTDQFTVVDGKFTSNGNDTPWLTRCR